jgi:hypothetical protein
MLLPRSGVGVFPILLQLFLAAGWIFHEISLLLVDEQFVKDISGALVLPFLSRGDPRGCIVASAAP